MAEDSEMASSTSTSQLQSSSQISHEDAAKRSQIPAFSGFPDFPNSDYPMIPVMYPAIIPGLASLQNQEQMNHGAGIYAIPVLPFVGHVSGLPSNTLIPLTYNIPMRSANETGSGGEEHGQAAQPQQHQQQQAAAQGQVVRRFQIAFQLDLLLMLKLAAGEAGAENGNRPAEGNGAAVENENVVEGDIENGGNHWWGIVNEIQMIIFGFITSLLPGFHNID
ncbi:hypothetical protein SLEP1_g30521 [Rubroshorea leprosula]|uniref:Uncharacterized protein n=1 Tax=Rubroshorea leprosula TaxID=152421 RepID=A0AAV5K8U7_9ROSI|nr:hypothetical protein SLEP1_g30521 [Rubroshorea leprosula]